MFLSSVLVIFLNKLYSISFNLRTTCLSLAGVFFLINTDLMIFKIDEIDWLKWLLNITLKVGFVIWIIDNYSYLIREIKSGFLLISNLALGVTGSTKYLENPSLLIDKGIDMSASIMKLMTLSPSAIVFALIALITFLGYAFIGFMDIIIIIEFYLLTWISIIFIPFGLLDVTKSYYLNVFKTIAGCSIKLCVLNLILNLSTKILRDLTLQEQALEGPLQAVVIILLLAYFVISIPSLATALMTGTPTSSATEALRLGMPAITAMSTTLTVAYLIGKGGVEGAKETGFGMNKGMDTGGHIGGSIGELVLPLVELIKVLKLILGLKEVQF